MPALSFPTNPPLRLALTICTVSIASFAAFQAVTILASLVPLLRTGPSPVARKLIKTSKVKTKPLSKGLRRVYAGKKGDVKRIIEDDFEHAGKDNEEEEWEYKLEILTNTDRDGKTIIESGNINSEDVNQSCAPLVFLHGGMGSARCYDRWMDYFAKQGRRKVFSISLRAHGNSTRPPNFTHLTKASFADDLDTALTAITNLINPNANAKPSNRPVLIGHSAGGGLSQYYLSSTTVPTSSHTPQALILLAPFPPSGGAPTFRNWALFDPWFSFRFIWDGCDPMSPLSSPNLVKRAFFGDSKRLLRTSVKNSGKPEKEDDESVEEFFEQMNPEENGAWPASMMFSFADPAKVKSSVNGKVHLITASQDRLMSPNIMKRVKQAYDNVDGNEIGLDVVQGSGHHIMFDNQWKQGLKYVEDRLDSWGL
ncbi:alpha/beta-hydrolase [Dendrothele bispora CBS 962.96]|uniref:Alpha/beta-hydrolase n=1 Tax=Dendrothele bispora (strain CBS 962.96) TaxID=1314807 RepID=A0A4S8LEJ0_DENBC|nr:alpha/beta-hydrolase [Dendrothele bispora CBS 962.96]